MRIKQSSFACIICCFIICIQFCFIKCICWPCVVICNLLLPSWSIYWWHFWNWIFYRYYFFAGCLLILCSPLVCKYALFLFVTWI